MSAWLLLAALFIGGGLAVLMRGRISEGQVQWFLLLSVIPFTLIELWRRNREVARLNRDPMRDHEDSGCGHPKARQTVWEKETNACLACHHQARTQGRRERQGVVALIVFSMLVAVFLAAHGAFHSPQAVPLFAILVLLPLTLLSRWWIVLGQRMRNHVSPTSTPHGSV